MSQLHRVLCMWLTARLPCAGHEAERQSRVPSTGPKYPLTVPIAEAMLHAAAAALGQIAGTNSAPSGVRSCTYTWVTDVLCLLSLSETLLRTTVYEMRYFAATFKRLMQSFYFLASLLQAICTVLSTGMATLFGDASLLIQIQ